MGQPPDWIANIARNKCAEEESVDDWRASFIELRERYLKVVHENMRLREQLKKKKQPGRRRRRSGYNADRDEPEFDDDLSRRVDGIRRGESVNTDEW